MKRRSIGGFITGLIGILIGLPIGFYSYITLILILALGGLNVLAYSVYLFFPALFFAILGVCFYFTKARLGGVFMLISTLLYIIPFLCGIYAILTLEGATVDHGFMILLCIGNIPSLLTFVSCILGFTARAKQTQMQTPQYPQMPPMPPYTF